MPRTHAHPHLTTPHPHPPSPSDSLGMLSRRGRDLEDQPYMYHPLLCVQVLSQLGLHVLVGFSTFDY